MTSNHRCPSCLELLDEDGVCPACGRRADDYQSIAEFLPANTVLKGHYVLGRVIGTGGYAITYIAYDEETSRTVAIKELYPSQHFGRAAEGDGRVVSKPGTVPSEFEHLRMRFFEEAATLIRLAKNSDVINVYDYFEANDTAYLVMEYVRGKTLTEVMRERGGRIAPDELFRLIRPVMDELVVLHSENILHRDISPDNIMVAQGRARLIDFGSARDIERHTKLMGNDVKDRFSPIEQYQGTKQGPYTDVYALCATILTCLTGELPPRSLDLAAHAKLMLPSDFGVTITKRQERALRRGMQPLPFRRLQDVTTLMRLLYETGEDDATDTAASGTDAEAEVDDSVQVSQGDMRPPHPHRGRLFKIALVVALGMLGVAALPEPDTQQSEPDAHASDGDIEENDLAGMLRADDKIDERDESGALDQVFGSVYTRDQISSVTFLDVLPTERDTEGWDVSEAGDGSVRAWFDANAGGYVDLTIAADGRVTLPRNCRNLFRRYRNARTIDFTDAVDSSRTTDMAFMFANCTELVRLTVDGLDTAHVTSMRGMFLGDESLKKLDVSGFDTSRVTDMSRIFGDCPLDMLDLSTWDLSALRVHEDMFGRAREDLVVRYPANDEAWERLIAQDQDESPTFDAVPRAQFAALASFPHLTANEKPEATAQGGHADPDVATQTELAGTSRLAPPPDGQTADTGQPSLASSKDAGVRQSPPLSP